MAELFNFYGREVIDPGVYSKILIVGQAEPIPSGVNALMIIAEAINGPAFGESVAIGNLSGAKLIFGEQGPAIEAVFRALNSSPELSSAQDIRVFNPRALVAATGIIETTAGGDDAIDIKSRIYGPIGNGIVISLASGLAKVSFPWSDDDFERTIDNPVFNIIMPSGYITIGADQISVGPTGALIDFKFLDYPKLIDLINAIETAIPTVDIVKDATTSDNQSTIDYFDHIIGETDISSGLDVKADLWQLVDFLNLGVYDIEVEKLDTATTMVQDFTLTLSGGTSGTDPDAVQWGKVYEELIDQKVAVTCPIADGLAAPYDETLTKAVMSLDAQHAIAMNQPNIRGKMRQSFISIHGGYGWSGKYLTEPTNADAITTIANLHNSEYVLFFGSGLNALNQAGIEYAQLPCYFAVQAASMFLGGLASRVLTNQRATAIKASKKYNYEDTKKLHLSNVIIPVTDEAGATRIRLMRTTWKTTNEPMKTIPSQVRCAMLTDNDVARKLEAEMIVYQGLGFAPQNAIMRTFIRRVLETHQKTSINWLESFGEISFTSSGVKFEYNIKDQLVPQIAEYGFGEGEFLNA
ncbi:MAG: hypothetical protein JSU85_08715 [Candidatus Zixiibacteriota bacterium]|nr:MAG: hypothetical protein JSU85_08715 [candidate division Zixibacteria bacterium]